MPASRHATRAASVLDAEQERLANRGVASTAALGWDLRQAALSAYRRGDDPVRRMRDKLRVIVPKLQDLMVAAHLQGRLRARMTAATAESKSLSLANVYKAATDAISRRLGMTAPQLNEVRQMYGQTAATFTGDLAGMLEEKVGAAISEATQRGLHVREGADLIGKAFDAAGVTPTNSYTFQTIYRTQTSLAYSAGRLSENAAPEIQEILWGYEYVTVGDDRVRPQHVALEGVRRPKDDPFWSTHMPPNGYNCRCTVIEVFNEQTLAEPTAIPEFTTDERGRRVPVEPDPGWAFNPGDLFGDGIGLRGRAA